MIVLTNKYSAITFGFSIITLYTSVILVLARVLRGGLSISLGELGFSYVPNPTVMLQLCRSVGVARRRNRH